jgi:hypothetical protein
MLLRFGRPIDFINLFGVAQAALRVLSRRDKSQTVDVTLKGRLSISRGENE